MPVSDKNTFFIDPNRCIGCQACVQACSECDTHKGYPMIHLEFIDRSHSTQTVPMVCMHCETPTCAEVCPADAIKRRADGIVRSAREAALRRLQQLRPGLPVRRAQDEQRIRPDDEVRHVLRPHFGGQASRCAPPSAPAGRCSIGTREQLRSAAAAVGAGQPLPVRRAADPRPRCRCWRRATGRRQHLDVLSAMDGPDPRGMTLNLLDDVLFAEDA